MSTSPLPRIHRLSDAVIQRIAAGEILHRPANAVKELLENSIDARATQICITIKEGGLKLLQVQDNGTGIPLDDLAIVCERFTTSKLDKYDDLMAIGTFGFRGEALASISHVSHLSILTKTANSVCAYKAFYKDGKLFASKPSLANADPRPAAGNVGTTITAEDLFHNVPLRRKAFKNEQEEYARIVEVVARYAIEYPHISFLCRKVGGNTQDVSTKNCSATLDVLKQLYPRDVINQLVPISETQKAFSYAGYISNSTFNSKKLTLILFINHRLIESLAIKRTLESIYSRFLTKGSHPFVYLSLQIPPHRVDVNIHPTKKEVQFLDEDYVLECLTTRVMAVLGSENVSRTFSTPAISSKPMFGGGGDGGRGGTGIISGIGEKRGLTTSDVVVVRENRLVRTDPKTRTLDSYMTPSSSMPSQITSQRTPIRQPQKEPVLASISSLLLEIEAERHDSLSQLLRDHTFVGCVDAAHSLLQHLTKLYLVRTDLISKELFYQTILDGFDGFECYLLEPAIELMDLVEVAFDNPLHDLQIPHDYATNRHKHLQQICNLLLDKAELLSDCFAIVISQDGKLTGLPSLLNGYRPNVDRIPYFLVRLATLVTWDEEKPCFRGVAEQLAWLHIPETETLDGDILGDEEFKQSFRWAIENQIFANARHMTATNAMVKTGAVVELADLTDLYRIFERC